MTFDHFLPHIQFVNLGGTLYRTEFPLVSRDDRLACPAGVDAKLRVAKALGANEVSCDPKTGIYTITFSDKAADVSDHNPWDEVRTNANQKRAS
jgi:hypothetical protein